MKQEQKQQPNQMKPSPNKDKKLLVMKMIDKALEKRKLLKNSNDGLNQNIK